jgi:diguanylate cyclase (GGDEF)-like protein/PAS domain S-box-containing protein
MYCVSCAPVARLSAMMRAAMSYSRHRQILAAGAVVLAATVALTVFFTFAGMPLLAAAALGFALGVVLLLTGVQLLQHRSFKASDHAAALIGYVDAQQRFRFNNATYETWLDATEITGRTVKEVLGDAVYDAVRPHVEKALNGQRTTFETRLVAGGRSRHVQATYVPDIDGEGRVRGFFETVIDITRLKEVERELARLAHYDRLTGAVNLVAFEDHLCQGLARARRAGTGIAVMSLCIDRFQELERQLGDAASEELLREFVIRLKASVRATDTVGRFGANEFAVVVEAVGGRDEIDRVARKIFQAIRAPMILNKMPLLVTTSIGVALGLHDAAPDQMLKDASTALSWAKTAGGNSFRVNEPRPVKEAQA